MPKNSTQPNGPNGAVSDLTDYGLNSCRSKRGSRRETSRRARNFEPTRGTGFARLTWPRFGKPNCWRNSRRMNIGCGGPIGRTFAPLSKLHGKYRNWLRKALGLGWIRRSVDEVPRL